MPATRAATGRQGRNRYSDSFQAYSIALIDPTPLQNRSKLLSISIEQDEIEGINVYHVTPAEVDPRHEDHLFVYVHGGAFVTNAGEAGLAEPMIIAHRTKMRVLSIDHRMPPKYPTPAGGEDVVSVYQHLLKV